MLIMENLQRLHVMVKSIALVEVGEECSEKLDAISARYSSLLTKASANIAKLEELNRQDVMLMKAMARLKRKESLVQTQIAEKTEVLTTAKTENLSSLRKHNALSAVLKRVESVVGNYQGCVLKQSLEEQKTFVETRTAELKQIQVDRLLKNVQSRAVFLEGGFLQEKRRSQEETSVQLQQMQRVMPNILTLLKSSGKPSPPSTGIDIRKPTIVSSTSPLSSVKKSDNTSRLPEPRPLERKKEKSVGFNLTLDQECLEKDDLLLNKSVQKEPPTPEVALSSHPIKHEMTSGPPPGVHVTEDKFWCTCGANYYQKKGLIRHMCSGNYGRIFKCPECCKSFARHSTMKLHLEKIHDVLEVDNYGCRACGKTFPEFRLLRNHRIDEHDFLNARKLSMSQRRKEIRKEVRNETKGLDSDLDDGDTSDDSLDVNLLLDNSIGACA